MAKFVILLVLVCCQFSRQEDLGKLENGNELISDEIPLPVKETSISEILDGADEDQWYKGKDDKFDDDWTEEDEKWLQGIQDDVDDDDDDWTEEDEKWLQGIQDDDDDPSDTEKLIDEIEEWIEKTHPEKSNNKWLLQIENWLDKIYDDYYDWDSPEDQDVVKKEETVGLTVDKNNNLDLYYSWLYRLKLKKSQDEKARSVKRFSSV